MYSHDFRASAECHMLAIPRVAQVLVCAKKSRAACRWSISSKFLAPLGHRSLRLSCDYNYGVWCLRLAQVCERCGCGKAALTNLCHITDLAWLLVRVNADHVHGALKAASTVYLHLSCAFEITMSSKSTMFLVSYLSAKWPPVFGPSGDV